MYGNDFMKYKDIRDALNKYDGTEPLLINEQTGEVTPLHVDVVSDAVNSPPHYKTGGIEAIEGIEASMGPEAFAGYLKGSVTKYLWRYEKKGKPLEDLKKARWFLDRLIQKVEGA
jgi:hypothetical protein